MKSEIRIPEFLKTFCREKSEYADWLETLPEIVLELASRWQFRIREVLERDASCSWVATVDKSDCTPAVLKIGIPHFEALDEAKALRFLNGDPTVALFEFDSQYNALLIEHCDPGVSLRAEAEATQDVVIASILKRFWKMPDPGVRFRTLADMISQWNLESLEKCNNWRDPALAKEGVRIRAQLAGNSNDTVLLATDLHAGNVLSANRQPWLAIDPKPFVGDRTYDATQHLLNCKTRLEVAPEETVRRFATLLNIDARRLKQWLFARLACEFDGELQSLAHNFT